MSIEVRLHARVAEIPAATWDALLPDDASPFLEHGWLDALEEAGCVAPDRGWLPRHIGVYDGGRLVAAAPAYVKGNSEGEFVFDHQWAGVAHRLGIDYYPKLILAVPFTPATGDRVLTAPGEDRAALVGLVAEAARAMIAQLGLSSAHMLFPRSDEAAVFEAHGFGRRLGLQFHWKNKGYSTYDDFLGSFASKRRHQLRRERRLVAEQGITLETRRGADVDEETLAFAYKCYLATVDKFTWGRRYLNEKFFRLAVERFAGPRDDAWKPKRASFEVVVAKKDGRAIGGAVNVAKNGRLYGRYWGAEAEFPFLHFAVCYYHSIDECIARGFSTFEPGAGGEHKVARGFSPTATESAHAIADKRLDRIVRDFLPREREHIEKIVSGELEGEE